MRHDNDRQAWPASGTNGTNGVNFTPFTPLTTFDQGLDSATSLVVPADLTSGVLILLTDVISLLGTIKTSFNQNKHVQNQIIGILRANGMCT